MKLGSWEITNFPIIRSNSIELGYKTHNYGVLKLFRKKDALTHSQSVFFLVSLLCHTVSQLGDFFLLYVSRPF